MSIVAIKESSVADASCPISMVARCPKDIVTHFPECQKTQLLTENYSHQNYYIPLGEREDRFVESGVGSNFSMGGGALVF